MELGSIKCAEVSTDTVTVSTIGSASLWLDVQSKSIEESINIKLSEESRLELAKLLLSIRWDDVNEQWVKDEGS